MINEQYIDLVTDYIEGSITTEQRTLLNELINSGEIDIHDVKALEETYRNLDNLPQPDPSEGMSNRFYRMLEQEKEKELQSASKPDDTKILSRLIKLVTIAQPKRLAFALGIFVAGMLIGNWATPFQNYRQQLDNLSAEVSQMREVMMLSLLDNDSVTERLKAVNISSEMQPTDNKVADALLKTLQNDSNINVRLAAIEALLHHASQPMVREGLVSAITAQESPIIQAALADAMLILHEKQSVEKFKKLLDQNNLDKNLRNKLQNTVTALS